MKKTLFSLFFLAATHLTMSAQHHSLLKPTMNFPSQVSTLLGKNAMHGFMHPEKHASKTTGSVTRLMALSSQTGTGTGYQRNGDSTRVFWHKEEGGDFDFGQLYSSYLLLSLYSPTDPLEGILATDSMNIYQTTAPGSAYSNLYYREMSSFDANDNMIMNVQQDYNTSTSMWVNANRSVYTYNAQMKMTSVTYESWIGSAWQPDTKIDYSYNVNNLLASETYYAWDAGLMMLAPSDNYNYTYDAANNFIQEEDKIWNGTAWENAYKMVNNYNAANQRTRETQLQYNGTSYDSSSRTMITYNAAGKISSVLSESYDVTAVWIPSVKADVMFDAANNPTSLTYKTWDAGTSMFMDAVRYVYTFSGNNLTSAALEQYDGTNWTKQQRYTLQYNAANLLTNLATQTWVVAAYVPTPADAQSKFYYETIVSVKDITRNTSITASPNPAQTAISISVADQKIKSVSIIDVLGKVVSQQNLNNTSSTTISVHDLPSGTYFLHVKTDKGTGVKQITVNR